jgi:hypothetical protein
VKYDVITFFAYYVRKIYSNPDPSPNSQGCDYEKIPGNIQEIGKNGGQTSNALVTLLTLVDERLSGGIIIDTESSVGKKPQSMMSFMSERFLPTWGKSKQTPLEERQQGLNCLLDPFIKNSIDPSFFKIFYGKKGDEFNTLLESKKDCLNNNNSGPDLLIFRPCSGYFRYCEIPEVILDKDRNPIYKLVSASIVHIKLKHAVCGYFCHSKNENGTDDYKPYIFDSHNYISNDEWHKGNMRSYTDYINQTHIRRKGFVEKQYRYVVDQLKKFEGKKDDVTNTYRNKLNTLLSQMSERLLSGYYNEIHVEDFYYSFIIYCKLGIDEISIPIDQTNSCPDTESNVEGQKMEELIVEGKKLEELKNERRRDKQIDKKQLVEFKNAISRIEKIYPVQLKPGEKPGQNEYLLSTIFMNLDGIEPILEKIKEYYKKESDIDFQPETE